MAFSMLQSMAIVYCCPWQFYYVTDRPGMPPQRDGDNWDDHYQEHYVPALDATAQTLRLYGSQIVELLADSSSRPDAEQASDLCWCALQETLLAPCFLSPHETLRTVLHRESPETLAALEARLAALEVAPR